LPSVAVIASLGTSPFIVIARTSERVGRCATFDLRSSASVVQLCGQGIRGPSTFALGRGGTPQTCGAQGGSGGVGMRSSLPCVAADPPVMQVPVNVSLSGYGVVKPSVSVCRNATIWFSSWSVKPRLPVVQSRFCGTSGLGQQSTFSVVPGGQCPEVTSNEYRSRVL